MCFRRLDEVLADVLSRTEEKMEAETLSRWEAELASPPATALGSTDAMEQQGGAVKLDALPPPQRAEGCNVRMGIGKKTPVETGASYRVLKAWEVRSQERLPDTMPSGKITAASAPTRKVPCAVVVVFPVGMGHGRSSHTRSQTP